MRIIVTGDRNWRANDLAEEVLTRLLFKHGPGLVIVHGGSAGIDRAFAEACGELGIRQETHHARWGELEDSGAVIRQDKDGRSFNANARQARNAEMISGGAILCLAFHRAISASKRTKD